MAADSLVSGGGEILGYTTKVEQLPDGRIFGACGFSEDAQLFSRWMHGAPDKPELSDDFGALILTPDGHVFWIGKKLEPVKYLAPMAVGSGADYAIGAMLAGATPEYAVKIAAVRDLNTGGDVTSISLKLKLQEVA
jgi:hypothetical protein